MNEELIIGEKYSVLEDDRVFISGILTEIYQGTENGNPCIGVVLDNGNGFLIDKYRKIIKI